MSNFKKRLAETRNLRKTAEGPDDKQAFLAALEEAGVKFPAGNETVLDNHPWGKISVLDILAGPLGNELMQQSPGQGIVDYFLQKVEEFDSALDEWSNTFYNKLGEETINKLTNPKGGALTRSKDALKAYETIKNFSLAGSGDKTINPGQSWAGLENEELEKMASALVAEFEAKVRSLLSALKK